MITARFENRPKNALRPVRLTPQASRYAEGSCLVEVGYTRVLCTASVEEKVPPFLKGTGKGWVTAEYGMLPRATHTRMDREAAKGKQSGRTQEIQRLIGRAIRASIDLNQLGEKQIKIDCDVLEADGGTRTASITGAYVALFHACRTLHHKKLLAIMPTLIPVAAISCGINEAGNVLLDLDYEEDSKAAVDANVVMTATGQLVEVQASAEGATFAPDALTQMLSVAHEGLQHIFALQEQACI
jgi:ribonuclease PH